MAWQTVGKILASKVLTGGKGQKASETATYQTPKKKKKNDDSVLQGLLKVAQQGSGAGRASAFINMLRGK